MASTDAKPYPIRGQAYRVTFPILDADGDLVTGAAGLDSEISQDAGTFIDCTNEATEIAASSGIYYLDLTANEMNTDTVALIIKTSTSGAKTTPIVLYPVQNGDIPVNVTQWQGSTTIASLGDMRAQINDALLGYEGLKSSVSGRYLDISTGGEAGLDWANIGSPTNIVNLSNTQLLQTNFLGNQALTDIKSRIETVINAYEPAKISVSGRLMDVSAAGNVGIDWNNIDNPTTPQSLSGTTISAVSGAVGSVTGNIGGNVTGSVGSLGANAVDNTSLAADACAKIADSGIQRGATNWENNSDNRSLGWMISKLVNRVAVNAAGDTLTIYKSDDLTSLFTQSITTSGGAAPITELNTV